MPKIPGVNHLDALRALEKAGFRIVRQGKHVVMSDGVRILTIPRHNPVNAFTMGGIARDAGLTVEQFKSFFESDAIQRIKDSCRASLRAATKSMVELNPRVKLRYLEFQWAFA